MAVGHDQTQFEIPVVDHIVDKTMDGLNLRNPVATDLLTKGIWFFNLFAITSFLISIITLFQYICSHNDISKTINLAEEILDQFDSRRTDDQ